MINKHENAETITHTSFSLNRSYIIFALIIITKTVWFNYIQFSQASIMRNTTLDKDLLPLISDNPLSQRGV